ncbi:MAG: flagellar basal body rod protein FlgB [Desulfuromonadaceae bacterium]|nr:flagellar basal body rod protein FlgB [Desulfuromonas sp.]MDY0184984.1 flagellar basal body rod protein FlgB [Desulfuromonadaceae bacterium]
MSSIGIFDSTTAVLKKSLDLRMQNQQVIAANVANAETPGYATKRFEFEDQLRAAVAVNDSNIRRTHPQHMPRQGVAIEKVNGQIVEYPDTSGLGDRNSVDMDSEMLAMAKNQIYFEAATQLLNKKMGILKYTIQGQ